MAFEILLNQARRHCFPKATPSQLSLLLRRSLSSASSESLPEPNPENQSTHPSIKPDPTPITPISYPIKPKQLSHSSQSQQDHPPPPLQRPRNPETRIKNPVLSDARTWTREDIRFIKDVPAISPVSYPTRVAPLPEDRVEVKDVEEEGEDKYKDKDRNEEYEKERKRIEADHRVIRRVFRIEEEKVPFPTLIKVENKRNEKTIYDLKEAIKLVKVNSKRNFDETLEAHVKLTAELRRTDLSLSGSASLPHGTGKAFKVAVFAEGAAADEARAAGADVVGGQELIEGIKIGTVKVDFDKCIATHQLMPLVGKQISKVLRRLTPNAKNGTVTNDISRVVREAKRNIDFKKDKSAIVHVGLGKVSFPEEALRENVGAFVNALLLAKPAGLKKSSKYAGYVNSVHICSSMGPSFPVSVQSLSIAADRHNRLQLN